MYVYGYKNIVVENIRGTIRKTLLLMYIFANDPDIAIIFFIHISGSTCISNMIQTIYVFFISISLVGRFYIPNMI